MWWSPPLVSSEMNYFQNQACGAVQDGAVLLNDLNNLGLLITIL